MPKFHVNNDGNVGECHAVFECPFGDLNDDHYGTKEEAQKAFEKAQENKPIRAIKKNKKEYCSRICTLSHQNKWTVKQDKLYEWKHLDQWAQNFKNKNNQSPSKFDVQEYFGIAVIPKVWSQELFNLDQKKYTHVCPLCKTKFSTKIL